MLTLPSSVRVFLAVEPIDMRGSFDALAGQVRQLSLDPQDGHLYVFTNARKTLMKVLFFDRSGWCILAKRLEQGTFQIPAVAEGQRQLAIDAAVLGLILEGVDLSRAPRRKRYTAPG
jgi:transposase